MPEDPLHLTFERTSDSDRDDPPHLSFDDAPHVAFDEIGGELLPVLESLRGSLARHPIAVQAAFSALAREGRAYALTPEGAALRETLASSALFDRARLVWETLSLSGFTEQQRGIVPSVYLDAVLRAVSAEALEPLLSKVFDAEP